MTATSIYKEKGRSAWKGGKKSDLEIVFEQVWERKELLNEKYVDTAECVTRWWVCMVTMHFGGRHIQDAQRKTVMQQTRGVWGSAWNVICQTGDSIRCRTCVYPIDSMTSWSSRERVEQFLHAALLQLYGERTRRGDLKSKRKRSAMKNRWQ